jgi:DNA-binding MarR family transcriptional regulator
MAHTKAGAAFTELVLEIFRLNGNLLAEGDRLAAPLGLTSARWQILGAIEAQELSVAQISRRMGVTRQNVQRIADALEKIGMLSFTPNPAHQRAKLVRLSAKGSRIMHELGARQVQWANRIASVASDSEIRTLLETMRKLASRLGSEGPKKPRSAAL